MRDCSFEQRQVPKGLPNCLLRQLSEVDVLPARLRGYERPLLSPLKDAGHTLEVTPNGFDVATPQRYSRGFPAIMLQWLRVRHFTL